MLGLADRLGIDLGTSNIVVYAWGRGVVIREPSVVAVEQRTRKIMAVGHEAQAMLGRTPGSIVATRPLRDGVIADYSITREMLSRKSTAGYSPRLAISADRTMCPSATALTASLMGPAAPGPSGRTE